MASNIKSVNNYENFGHAHPSMRSQKKHMASSNLRYFRCEESVKRGGGSQRFADWLIGDEQVHGRQMEKEDLMYCL